MCPDGGIDVGGRVFRCLSKMFGQATSLRGRYYDDLPTSGSDSGRAFRDLEWEEWRAAPLQMKHVFSVCEAWFRAGFVSFIEAFQESCLMNLRQ